MFLNPMHPSSPYPFHQWLLYLPHPRRAASWPRSGCRSCWPRPDPRAERVVEVARQCCRSHQQLSEYRPDQFSLWSWNFSVHSTAPYVHPVVKGGRFIKGEGAGHWVRVNGWEVHLIIESLPSSAVSIMLETVIWQQVILNISIHKDNI